MPEMHIFPEKFGFVIIRNGKRKISTAVVEMSVHAMTGSLQVSKIYSSSEIKGEFYRSYSWRFTKKMTKKNGLNLKQ